MYIGKTAWLKRRIIEAFYMYIAHFHPELNKKVQTYNSPCSVGIEVM